MPNGANINPNPDDESTAEFREAQAKTRLPELDQFMPRASERINVDLKELVNHSAYKDLFTKSSDPVNSFTSAQHLSLSDFVKEIDPGPGPGSANWQKYSLNTNRLNEAKKVEAALTTKEEVHNNLSDTFNKKQREMLASSLESLITTKGTPDANIQAIRTTYDKHLTALKQHQRDQRQVEYDYWNKTSNVDSLKTAYAIDDGEVAKIKQGQMKSLEAAFEKEQQQLKEAYQAAENIQHDKLMATALNKWVAKNNPDLIDVPKNTVASINGPEPIPLKKSNIYKNSFGQNMLIDSKGKITAKIPTFTRGKDQGLNMLVAAMAGPIGWLGLIGYGLYRAYKSYHNEGDSEVVTAVRDHLLLAKHKGKEKLTLNVTKETMGGNTIDDNYTARIYWREAMLMGCFKEVNINYTPTQEDEEWLLEARKAQTKDYAAPFNPGLSLQVLDTYDKKLDDLNKDTIAKAAAIDNDISNGVAIQPQDVATLRQQLESTTNICDRQIQELNELHQQLDKTSDPSVIADLQQKAEKLFERIDECLQQAKSTQKDLNTLAHENSGTAAWDKEAVNLGAVGKDITRVQEASDNLKDALRITPDHNLSNLGL